MAKSITPALQAVAHASANMPTDTTGNSAAPEKKKRTPAVKYTTVRESSYKQVDGKEPVNPLDRVVQVNRGGVSFPGIEWERNILGFVAKVPAKATALKNPTLRDLFALLVELFDQPAK